MITLKNEYLTVETSEMGAELQSIKDTNDREFLWQGDANYWGKRSPILFPIVCGLWEGKYRTEGKEYTMERHGFARDMEFSVLDCCEDSVTFELHSDDNTLKVYPYDFDLYITYILEGNNVEVEWNVFNPGKKEMLFQIGGHPAFNVPGVKKGEPLKGKILFDTNENLERIFGNVGGCILPERFPFKTNNGVWDFNEDSFKDDAVIFDHSQTESVALLDTDGTPAVTISMTCPALGIWSPYGKNAPFVCIEPWFGIHDYAGYDGELSGKYLINRLQPGATFLGGYTITIK